MKKKKLYLYNPETDNFERFYPSFKDRMGLIISSVLIGLVLAVGFYLIIFYTFETPTVENLQAENSKLRDRIKEQKAEIKDLTDGLVNRVDYTMSVMRTIQERDSNFYRVVMQMDSISPNVIYPDELKESAKNDIKKVGDSNLISALTLRLDSLDILLLRQSASFNQLIAKMKDDRDRVRHIPSIIPLHKNDYTVSSGFGQRIDPVYDIPQFHKGMDFAAGMGTPVYATADGTVSVAVNGDTGYGNHVDIEHGFNYMTRYGHLSKIMVKQGQSVKRGDLIGLVGSTGKSTGPHLHYEVRYNGEALNPSNFYFLDITPAEYDKIVKQAANAGHVMD